MVAREYLDNIKLSVCAVGLIAHITRWQDDGLTFDGIFDQIYDMCSHDSSAAVGFIDLVEEGILPNFFHPDNFAEIQALAKK